MGDSGEWVLKPYFWKAEFCIISENKGTHSLISFALSWEKPYCNFPVKLQHWIFMAGIVFTWFLLWHQVPTSALGTFDGSAVPLINIHCCGGGCLGLFLGFK